LIAMSTSGSPEAEIIPALKVIGGEEDLDAAAMLLQSRKATFKAETYSLSLQTPRTFTKYFGADRTL